MPHAFEAMVQGHELDSDEVFVHVGWWLTKHLLYAWLASGTVLGLCVVARALRESVGGTRGRFPKAVSVYVCVFICVTTFVHSLLHFAVVSPLLAPARKTHSQFFESTYAELRARIEEPLPTARHDARRCNTVQSTSSGRTPECAIDHLNIWNGPGVCRELPCAANGSGDKAAPIVDTDALAGPLSLFREVRPMTEISHDITVEEFYAELVNFPIVIRDAISDPSHRLTAEDILRTCPARGEGGDKVQVGYSVGQPLLSQLSRVRDSQFAGLLTTTELTYAEFYDENVRGDRGCRPGQLNSSRSDVEAQLLDLVRRHMDADGGTTTEGTADIERKLEELLETRELRCGRGYMFEQSIMEFCREILDVVPLPSDILRGRFHTMFMDITMQLFERHFPTLFIGQAGTMSSAHQDADGSGFFIQVLSGRKLLRVVRVEDTLSSVEEEIQRTLGLTAIPQSLIDIGPYRIVDHAIEHNENFDIFHPTTAALNLTQTMTVFEAVLEAGDFAYVPSWALHGALNLVDGTVMIGGNFVPSAQFGRLHELIMHTHNTENFGKIIVNVRETMRRLQLYGYRLSFAMRLAWRKMLLLPIFRSRFSSGFTVGGPRARRGGWGLWFDFWDDGDECICCCDFATSDLSHPTPIAQEPYASACMRLLGQSSAVQSMQRCFRGTLWRGAFPLTCVGLLPAVLTLTLYVVGLVSRIESAIASSSQKRLKQLLSEDSGLKTV